VPAVSVSTSNSLLQVRVAGIPGHRYVLATATNLQTWTSVATNQLGDDGEWMFPDLVIPDVPMKWYRALAEP
jgi:hypothetical protein